MLSLQTPIINTLLLPADKPTKYRYKYSHLHFFGIRLRLSVQPSVVLMLL